MISNFRYSFATLANALYEEGKKDMAHKVLDRCMELSPQNRVPYNTSVIPLIQTYYSLDDTVKANEILSDFVSVIEQELTYYTDLQIFNPEKFQLISNEFQMNMSALYNLFSMANSFSQKEVADKVIAIMQRYDTGMSRYLR